MLTGTIRLARQADLPQLTAIYNQAIQAGRCTCDTAPFAPGQRQGWFEACQGKTIRSLFMNGVPKRWAMPIFPLTGRAALPCGQWRRSVILWIFSTMAKASAANCCATP